MATYFEPAQKFIDPTLYSQSLAFVVTASFASPVGTGAANLTNGPRLEIGTGANANSALRHISGMDSGGSFSMVKFYRGVVQPITSIAASVVYFCGFAALNAGAMVFATEKHIGFKYDPSVSANWLGTVSNGAAESTLDTTVAVVLNVDTMLAFQYDGVTATFWVNGVNRGVIATANVPTGGGTNGLSLTHYIDNKAAANARDIRIYDALGLVSIV